MRNESIINKYGLRFLTGATLIFEIKSIISINHKYSTGIAYRNTPRGRVPYGFIRLTNEATEVENDIISKLSSVTDHLPDLSSTKAVRVSAVFECPHHTLMTKSGKLKRVDLSNMWGLVENAIAKSLQVDDRLTTELSLEKRISVDNKNRVCVHIDFYH